MRKTQIDLFDLIEHVIDDVFLNSIYTFDMYRFLRSNQVKRPVVDEFVDSITAKNIQISIDELNLYLEGGSDSDHRQIREAYGHLGKPTARKIRDYLNRILTDAWKYQNDKRPGRRKGSKNRKKLTK
tara:strand:+ start:1629 stop:2009 length:381 start_codon:yes stop_codon:yes gene_type:complete